MNRDVVCQLPPEAGHPPCIAARLKKPASGISDASSDAGGTSLTRPCVAVAWFPHELIDVVACCTQYSRVSEPGNINNTTQWHDTSNISHKPRVRTEVDDAHEKMLDPIAGRNRWSRNGTTCPIQTQKGFPSWL